MNDSIKNPQSGQKWLSYALITLSSEPMEASILESWLRDRLQSLALPEELIDKVLGAARDAVTSRPAGIHQIRLLVYTTALSPLHGKTWGFFRTVKKGIATEDPALSTQEIAFFLYTENEFHRNEAI